MTLSILIWLPLVAGLLAAIWGGKAAPKLYALGAMATMAIAISFVARFDAGHDGLQFVTDEAWISELGVAYYLGMDGLNVVLVLLTAFVFAAAALMANLR